MGAFDGVNAPTLKVQFFFNGAYTDTPSTDLREINIYRGRPRPDQRIDAGQMMVTFDNRSGNYDPDNLSGPWVIAGVSELRDGLRARLVASWSGTSYVLYVGYLETTSLDPGFDAKATMTFVDAISQFGKVTAPAKKTPTYSGETTSTRVGRMLTYAGWPTGSSWRSLTGSVQLYGTTQNANVMDLIDECVQAEAGSFYISRTGVATFVNLENKFSRPTQLEFDDVRSDTTVEYNSLKTTPGTYQVVNTAVVNRGKLKQKFFKYKPSITKYGEKAVSKDAPILKDVTAQKLATYIAKKDAYPTTLVEEVTFTALAMDILYPDFLSTEIQDLIIVKRTTVDGRNLTFNLVVEGMRHQITPDTWETTFMTSTINAYRVILP